jgi:hypothetical protein
VNINDFIIEQSPIFQREGEEVVYDFVTTPVGSSPSAPSVIVTDKNGVDVTNSVTTGSATVGAGNLITLPKISGLQKASNPYHVVVWFWIGGNRLSVWADLYAY